MSCGIPTFSCSPSATLSPGPLQSCLPFNWHWQWSFPETEACRWCAMTTDQFLEQVPWTADLSLCSQFWKYPSPFGLLILVYGDGTNPLIWIHHKRLAWNPVPVPGTPQSSLHISWKNPSQGTWSVHNHSDLTPNSLLHGHFWRQEGKAGSCIYFWILGLRRLCCDPALVFNHWDYILLQMILLCVKIAM